LLYGIFVGHPIPLRVFNGVFARGVGYPYEQDISTVSFTSDSVLGPLRHASSVEPLMPLVNPGAAFKHD